MEERLIFFSAVLAAGILAQWLAWRLRLPSILLLLGFGFLGGQVYDASALIEDDTLFAVVSLSVAVIMLEGGLSLRFKELKEAGVPTARLIGFGVPVTWLLSALAAHFIAHFSWQVSLLLGAVLVVTGPTVIGPLLRTIQPRKPVGAILKWEGIVIDPVGAVLAVLVFGAVFASGHAGVTVPLGIGRTLLIGLGLGFSAAFLISIILRRHWVPDFLQSPFILVVGLVLFAVSNHFQHESGLLTVTVLGVLLGNQDRAPVRHIIEFKENLRTLLISSLFIVLGGRIGIDDIAMVWREALLFLAVLVLVIRPVSVWLSTLGTKLDRPARIYLAGMAPRGIVAAAVSAIFALDLASTGGDFAGEADRMVAVAYTVIVGTVAIYGLLGGPLARWLGLAVKDPQGVLVAGISSWSIGAARVLNRAGFRVLMVDSNYTATRAARMAGIQAVNANILSEWTPEELDLSGIGNFLAVTPNDHVNAMACMGFSHTLGRSHVYQLPPVEGTGGTKGVSTELTGRPLFGPTCDVNALRRLEETGATIKATPITKAFDHASFLDRYGQDAIILFIIRASGRLTIPEGAHQLTPKKGDTIIGFVHDPEGGTPLPTADPGGGKPQLP